MKLIYIGGVHIACIAIDVKVDILMTLLQNNCNYFFSYASFSLSVGLAVTLFGFFMIIYCAKRMCCSSYVTLGPPGDLMDKNDRGAYVRTATDPEEWEEQDLELDSIDDEEETWDPEAVYL